jgi:hypothetical protein
VDPKDDAIRERAIVQADAYVDSHDGGSEDEQARVDVLVYLRGRAEYAPTRELLDVALKGERPRGWRYLRLKVIGPLRDAGVPIVSSPQGYKLATSRRELDAFCDHVESVVLPLLERARRMLGTLQVELLDEPRREQLRRLLQSLDSGSSLL